LNGNGPQRAWADQQVGGLVVRCGPLTVRGRVFGGKWASLINAGPVNKGHDSMQAPNIKNPPKPRARVGWGVD